MAQIEYQDGAQGECLDCVAADGEDEAYSQMCRCKFSGTVSRNVFTEDSLKSFASWCSLEDDEEDDIDGNWQPWDLTRPLEGSCKLQLVKFDDPKGATCAEQKSTLLAKGLLFLLVQRQDTFWHSSSHVLGAALEDVHGGMLTIGSQWEKYAGYLVWSDVHIGPAVKEGFYYDMYLGEKRLSEADFPAIAERVCSLATRRKANHMFCFRSTRCEPRQTDFLLPCCAAVTAKVGWDCKSALQHAVAALQADAAFERLVISRDDALELFADNPFKVLLPCAMVFVSNTDVACTQLWMSLRARWTSSNAKSNRGSLLQHIDVGTSLTYVPVHICQVRGGTLASDVHTLNAQ
eukprot:5555251-Amphidinium_carterae.4